MSKNPQTGMVGKKIRIAVFASGAGTNAQKIIAHFQHSKVAEVAMIVCNKPKAGVAGIAQKEKIPLLLIERSKFLADGYLPELQHQIDFIVLAGFLWKIPQLLIDAFRNRIINIHPALLPKYGGQGMYGQRVHEAVLQSGDKESGITIHYVDEQYDNGDVIFQATCPVLKTDSPQTLAERIHGLEHAHFPKVVEETILKMNLEKYN